MIDKEELESRSIQFYASAVADLIKEFEIYRKSVENLGIETIFDESNDKEFYKQIKVLFREYYDLRTPQFYDKDIKTYVDAGFILSKEGVE